MERNNIHNLVSIDVLLRNRALDGQALVIEGGRVTGVVRE